MIYNSTANQPSAKSTGMGRISATASPVSRSEKKAEIKKDIMPWMRSYYARS